MRHRIYFDGCEAVSSTLDAHEDTSIYDRKHRYGGVH